MEGSMVPQGDILSVIRAHNKNNARLSTISSACNSFVPEQVKRHLANVQAKNPEGAQVSRRSTRRAKQRAAGMAQTRGDGSPA